MHKNIGLFSPLYCQVAFTYVFNLIIGVGALTMPKAFANVGWLVSTILTVVLCLMRLVLTFYWNEWYYISS